MNEIIILGLQLVRRCVKEEYRKTVPTGFKIQLIDSVVVRTFKNKFENGCTINYILITNLIH